MRSSPPGNGARPGTGYADTSLRPGDGAVMRLLDLNNSYSPAGGGIRVYHHRKMEYFSRSAEHLLCPGRTLRRARYRVEGTCENLPL